MELMTTNLRTSVYIQSELEFNQAKTRGLWQRIGHYLSGKPNQLLCFAEVAARKHLEPATVVGLQEIPLGQITGTVDRQQDFTATFAPRHSSPAAKERWRTIYSLAVTGKGFPPIAVYKIGTDHFVKDGHHRVSVAHHLGWETVQAEVIELQPVSSASFGCRGPDLGHCLNSFT